MGTSGAKSKAWLSSKAESLREREHFDSPTLSIPARVVVAVVIAKRLRFSGQMRCQKVINWKENGQLGGFLVVSGLRWVGILLGELP